MEVYLDDSFSTALIDWPTQGCSLRSPKYLLNKDDAIYVRATGLGSDPTEVETVYQAVTDRRDYLLQPPSGKS